MAATVVAALPSWPPKISGSSAGRMTNAASSVLPSRFGIARAGRPWSDVDDADRDEQDRDRRRATASTFCHQRPVELAGAEQLAEEDQPEQRRGAVEDVGRGREALDEHRQPGAPELPLVGGDLIAGAHAGADSDRFAADGRRVAVVHPVAREGDPP